MPVLSEARWASTGATTTITWSFAASNYASLEASYSGYKPFESSINAAYAATIEAAFAAWEAVANIDFVRVTDAASVNIRVGNITIDGRAAPGETSTLGTAHTWWSGGLYRAAQVYFDVDAYDDNNLYHIAVHEIGHAIGLGHTPLSSAVMYHLQNPLNESGVLSADDIEGVTALYGARVIGGVSTGLAAAAGNILRSSNGPLASELADRVASGTLTIAQATAELIKAADATTSVATLAYQFFTGKIPSAGGMDYLVSPSGPNPNNLNAAYYQNFNLENRYINFAVNLGKEGEGKAQFSAAYGGLTLTQATQKAYDEIFGLTPSDAKVAALLSGGRDLYFEAYGRDGLNGIGTKAAMVGWLMAEAEKADVGMYARANAAFLADLADGAAFAVDLIGTYGRPEFDYAG